MPPRFLPHCRQIVNAALLTLGALAVPALAAAQPAHGIAMYGAPALGPDFVHLPHANPDAPRGGRLTMAEVGRFDSLNPYILAGNAPWGVGLLTVESLLGRSHDEAFTLYGLLAESVETNDARDYVEFTLREQARFADGSPVTVADVMWSFETLGTQGHGRYRTAWTKIATMEQTGPRSVRFTFTEADRELPLILGLRPILQAAQFESRAFDESSMEPIIGSGPYVVGAVDPGRSIRFVRNPDWWGADLPFYRGQHNFDEIRYEYFADAAVAFEAFKAGDVDVWREGNAARWLDSYDFPALREGRVRQVTVPHQRPSGMTGFVFNTRRAPFDDWRVRDALIHAFNFELVNQTINAGLMPRIPSPFGNSPLAGGSDPAQGRVAELLAPYADTLLPGAIEGYALPRSDGTEANRANMRAATRALAEAGWTPDAAGVMRNAQGTALGFEILLRQGSAEQQAIANLYQAALGRLGIEARVATVDSAVYTERTNAYDFDVTHFTRFMSLSPGNEQWLYWGSAGVETPGSRNLMGMDSPAAEAMIRHLLEAREPSEFVAAAQALDRILMAGRYAVPWWYADESRLALASRLHFPERLPLYGDWTGFLPEVWWTE
jgi:peptide/nickel transport system substrate-binding protein